MKMFFFVMGVLLILFTLIPLIKSDMWYVRIFDFPHAQITVLTLLCLVGYLFYLRKDSSYDYMLVGALLLTVLYQLYRIYPYTPLSPKQVIDSEAPDEDATISILSANVYQYNRDSTRLIEVVKNADADIVILLETDDWWKGQAAAFKENYPNAVEVPLDNTYGMLFYSKYELINPRVEHVVDSEIPSVHTLVKLPSGKEIRFYAVHPTPPSPTEEETSTERDAELLIIAKMSKEKDLPTIVAGDLNDVAWSHTTRLFQKISGLLDPRIGRGFFNTFHAKFPFLRWPLDHIFNSDDFEVIEMKRLPHIGSDHFPIYIKLHYNPVAEVEQEEPQATAEEEQEAEEKIEKVEE